MFVNHYNAWIQSRLAGVKKYIPESVFHSKTLLELGSGHGHIGNAFHTLGAIVTSSDARKEYTENIHKTYPHLQTIVIDGDRDNIPEKYDIIVHWGLLYHLREIENHLQDVCNNCDLLLLESEVFDSDNDEYYIHVDESGFDQAFNSKGIRPSQAYVERILGENGFSFRCIKDPILNSDFHTYDWKGGMYGLSGMGMRRFWICWKNIDSPIRTGL